MGKLDDLFMMFDTFQEALYSNDPNIHRGGSRAASETSSRKSGNDAVDRAIGRLTGGSGPGGDEHNAGNKVMYEESILMTLLGPDYMQFISEETGEWVNEELVIERFQELFETRIRCIFDA